MGKFCFVGSSRLRQGQQASELPAGRAGGAALAVGALALEDVGAVGGVVGAAVGAGELVEGLAVVGAGEAEGADVELAVGVEVGGLGGGVVGHEGSVAGEVMLRPLGRMMVRGRRSVVIVWMPIV